VIADDLFALRFDDGMIGPLRFPILAAAGRFHMCGSLGQNGLAELLEIPSEDKLSSFEIAGTQPLAARIAPATPPCGVPALVRTKAPSDRTPAFRKARTNRVTRLSATLP
jgi:hypothetical protein